MVQCWYMQNVPHAVVQRRLVCLWNIGSWKCFYVHIKKSKKQLKGSAGNWLHVVHASLVGVQPAVFIRGVITRRPAVDGVSTLMAPHAVQHLATFHNSWPCLRQTLSNVHICISPGLVKLAVSSGAVSSVLLYCCTAPLLAVASSEQCTAVLLAVVSSEQWTAVLLALVSRGQQWAVDCCTAGIVVSSEQWTANSGQHWAVDCCTAGSGKQWAVKQYH